MKHVRVPEVGVVSARAKKVYELAMKPDLPERPESHDALSVAVDSLLESWEKLLDRLHALGVEAAKKGRVLAVEDLDLAGVIGDVRAAGTAIDSATRHGRWGYRGYSRSGRSDESSDFNIVGLQTIRGDLDDFLEQHLRAAKIMHDRREILRALAA